MLFPYIFHVWFQVQVLVSAQARAREERLEAHEARLKRIMVERWHKRQEEAPSCAQLCPAVQGEKIGDPQFQWMRTYDNCWLVVTNFF